MSAHVMTDLRRFTSKPATLVQHPLYDNFGPAIAQEAARDKLKLDKHQRILLFFGFIRKYKGLDLLLEAMHLLKIHAQNNPEFGMPALLIAGEFYEDAQPYKNLIEKYNLEDNVYAHTHFIPDSEVVNYLCAADVVVQPYRNATQSGVTPLAYHFEIPMIVTNVGALPDFVPHLKCGLVTQPNPQAIADSIIQFFTLNRLQLIEGVKEEKKKYSWQIMTEALWSVSKEKKT
jgi:glycosyltransferase involved in cell wall biosynthesis